MAVGLIGGGRTEKGEFAAVWRLVCDGLIMAAGHGRRWVAPMAFLRSCCSSLGGFVDIPVAVVASRPGVA